MDWPNALPGRFAPGLQDLLAHWIRGSPLVLLALVGTLAWLLAAWLTPGQPTLLLMGAVGGGLLGFAAWKQPPDSQWGAWIWTFSVFFLLFSLHRLDLDVPTRPKIQLGQGESWEDVEIHGFVQGVPSRPPPSTLPPWNKEPRVSIPVNLVSITSEGIVRESSGAILVRCPGNPSDFPLGSALTANGRLKALPRALNPGENPPLSFWRRQGMEGTLDCRSVPTVFPPGDSFLRGAPPTFQTWVEPLRRWAQDRLHHLLDMEEAGLAEALLLGNTQAVDNSEWDKFRKTGTIHALAISGQHLLVAGWIFQTVLILTPLSRAKTILLSTGFVVAYALVTGAQPSANRAALMAIAFSLLWFLGRKTPTVNVLALAWFLISVFQPGDLTSPGCQLSFLAVLLLDGWQRWTSTERREQADEADDPGAILDRLEIQLRSPVVAWFHSVWENLRTAYAVNAWVWLGLCPLLWHHTSLISLSALLFGPPIAMLCTAALILGMVGVLVPIPFLDRWMAWGANQCLHLTSLLAQWAESLPGSWFYLPPPPLGFVSLWLLLILFFLLPRLVRIPAWVVPLGVATLIGFFALFPHRKPPNHLEIHAMAVGHGAAILIEEPGGRTVLYDAGSMVGGETMGRVMAQVCWQKGILHLDEVILSHADWDHFNALTTLDERVKIHGVALGPTFFNKEEPQAQDLRARLQKKNIPVRVISAGEVAQSSGVEYRILHPPADQARPWTQNAASLVLAIRYEGKTVLLTGDLEPPGTLNFLSRPDLPHPILAMMAPHHGSPTANPDYLWSRLAPRLVFSSEGEERRTRVPGGAMAAKIPFWRTQEKGMITLQLKNRGSRARAWLTGETIDLEPGKGG